MNNICVTCKSTIDQQWSDLQNSIKNKIDMNSYLDRGFIERCIYCYKTLLELTEKKDHEWYLMFNKRLE